MKTHSSSSPRWPACQQPAGWNDYDEEYFLLRRGHQSSDVSIGATIDQLDALTLTEVGSLNELATPWYADQVLPFDITLAGANEYGAMTAAKVFGVEILNEGSGISIDDAVSEAQATFVARGVEPMQAVPSPPDQVLSSFRQQRSSRARAGHGLPGSILLRKLPSGD